MIAALVVGAAGYAATELVHGSTTSVRPPSPYGSQTEPDCDPPAANPVPCGVYEMTCEEKAAYHRRKNAEQNGDFTVVACATTKTD
ncbi:hypothetical protein ACGFMM_22630 [Streptomyces sp. NPDC048604]|uniref:hypothetical protein n=1 Tax=Streptomyces sp. NPDC048604 TaxID=3365578 RepID=UPI00372260E7